MTKKTPAVVLIRGSHSCEKWDESHGRVGGVMMANSTQLSNC